MSVSKPRILFATPVLHHPPVGGPTLRIENSIKALGRISDLSLYVRIDEKSIGGASAVRFYRRLSRKVIFSPHVLPEPAVRNYIKRVVNIVSKKVIGRDVCRVVYRGPKEDYSDVLWAARRVKADIIWLGYGNISYPLLKYLKENSRYPVVLDTDSVWSRFVLRGLPFARNDAERESIEKKGKDKEVEEEWGTRLADITTAVSDVESEYYRGLTEQDEKVMLFSNAIDLKSYRNIPAPNPVVTHPNIYLAGTFWPESPMEEAARWVLKEVWPTLKVSYPDLQFNIIGKGSQSFLADVAEDGVNVLGQVTSVLPWLCHADVVLVPLKYESGTRFKILEAGACRRAVVSTTLGAEGIPVRNLHDIMIADDPAGFIQAIVSLLSDQKKRETTGENLYDLVQREYSIECLARQGSAIIKMLQEMKDEHRR